MADNTTSMYRGSTSDRPHIQRRNGLSYRIMALTACCVAISTFAIGSISFLKIRTESDRLAQVNLQTEAQILSQRFYLDYYIIANDLVTISQTPPIQGLIRSIQNGDIDPTDGSTTDQWRSRLATIFRAVLRGRSDYFQFRYISAADDGRELVRVEIGADGYETTPKEELQRKSDEPYYQQAMLAPKGQVTFSNVTYNRERGSEDGTQTPTLRGMYPIDASDGSRFGFLIINVNYEKMLQNAFQEIAPKRHTFVINDLGDFMEHGIDSHQKTYRLELHDKLTRPIPPILNNVMVSGKDGFFATSGTVGYYVRQDSVFDQASANLGVFVAVPREEYFATANQNLVQFILLGLLLIGLSTVIATVFARRMMLPLSALTNRVRFSGPDDRLNDLPTQRSDEIGELAEAIQSRNLKLIEGRQRSAAIVNNVVDGLILINDAGKIIEFNPSCERIFGYNAEEIIGSNVSRLMKPEIARSHDNYLQRFREGNGGKVIDKLRELEAVDRWGRVFPIELAINVVQVDGKTKYSGIIRDISERKEVERLRGEFVSTVSHELRTPLTSIRGSLSLIDTMAPKDLAPKVRQLITMAQKNTERLIVLVNDILDFEKLQTEKTHYEFKNLNFNKEVQNAIELNQGYASDAEIELKSELVSKDLIVELDADKLQQILSNLISNAVKFTKVQGKVIVRTSHSGQRVRLEVEDEGDGIPESFKAYIFEPFSQAESGVARRQSGTGLGLNITKRIVEGMHGEIGFNTVMGTGTVFWVEFPLKNMIISQTSDNGRLSTARAKVRALHLEDDTDFHIVLGTGMDGDLELVHARTIVEARRLLEEYTFDLIIIDRMLKDGEGLDLIKYVPNPDKTKIVVVTARDENIHHIYVDDILVKSRNRPGDFVNRFAVIVDEIKERKRCA